MNNDEQENTVEETLPKPKLIKDLGMMYPKETSKYKTRFGIYKCPYCGIHFKSVTQDIKRCHTRSCGCYFKCQKTLHGYSDTKLYKTWYKVKDRVLNPKNTHYAYYGGRGITICDEWKNDFTKFLDWALSNGYVEDKGLTLDRIDNDKGYFPNNCRWATKTIQARNQRMKGNNTSGYRGVSFNKERNKFVAKIAIDKKHIHLGYFKTVVEGAIAYNNYIIENNLEGFNLNIIPNQEES